MRIRLGVSPDIDTATMGEAIDAALEASTVSQVPLIRDGKVPDIRTIIKKGKIQWKPEPPGDEHFDDAKTVLSRGWGDCDDLAPWLAASMRASGEAPDARAFVYQSGPKRWHAVVDRGDGKVLDPSRWAGMGRRRVQGVGAAATSPMWAGKLGIATHPYIGGYAARVDVPDSELPVSWTTITHGPTKGHAATSACQTGARIADLAGSPYEDDIARLQGIATMLTGTDVHVVGDILGELEEYLGEEGVADLLPAVQALGPHVGFGGFFKKIAKGVSKGVSAVAKNPLTKAGLSFVPGASAATAAFDLASNAANIAKGFKGGGGGGNAAPPPSSITSPTASLMRNAQKTPGTALSMPGGVVIVRF